MWRVLSAHSVRVNKLSLRWVLFQSDVLLWHAVLTDTGHTGELPSELCRVSQRDVLANRCPGWASGPGAAEAAGSPLALQHHHYHPTPDTVPGYCGDTTLGLCSSLVNKTDGCREEERRKRQEHSLIFKVTAEWQIDFSFILNGY